MAVKVASGFAVLLNPAIKGFGRNRETFVLLEPHLDLFGGPFLSDLGNDESADLFCEMAFPPRFTASHIRHFLGPFGPIASALPSIPLQLPGNGRGAAPHMFGDCAKGHSLATKPTYQVSFVSGDLLVQRHAPS